MLSIWKFSPHLETAVNIGYSCQLLTDDLIDVFVVDGITQDEVEKQLIKFKESVKIVNTFHPASKSFIDNLQWISFNYFLHRF